MSSERNPSGACLTYAPMPGTPWKVTAGRISLDPGRCHRARGFALAVPAPVRPGRYARLTVTDTGKGHGRRDARASVRAVLHDQGRVGQGNLVSGLAIVHGIMTNLGGAITASQRSRAVERPSSCSSLRRRQSIRSNTRTSPLYRRRPTRGRASTSCFSTTSRRW